MPVAIGGPCRGSRASELLNVTPRDATLPLVAGRQPRLYGVSGTLSRPRLDRVTKPTSARRPAGRMLSIPNTELPCVTRSRQRPGSDRHVLPQQADARERTGRRPGAFDAGDLRFQ